jgi:GrpB-like predicted nucleotidyltransferase (UPF0157 family)
MIAPYIVDYDPNWPICFLREREEILVEVRQYTGEIEHFGSTAVPGLCAKPIIDILVGLQDLSLLELFRERIQLLGYSYVKEHGPRRHFFRKPGNLEERAMYHLHAVEIGSEPWQRLLLFRDYLRSHPETVRAYALLKKQLVTQFGTYNSGKKDEFVQSVFAQIYGDSGFIK